MLIDLFNTKMPDQDKLKKAIDEKFISREKFSTEIENLVMENKMNYIDAIVEYCQANDIDLESVGKLVSKPHKERIKCDAIELNYLRASSKGKLPL